VTGIEIDGDDAGKGLVSLVVTVVELVVEAMEREAVRRMEYDDLSPEEIERLGTQLAAIEDELERLKESEGIEEGVENLRGDLDDLISDALVDVANREPGMEGFGD